MKRIPFTVINQMKSDIIRCDNQNEINGSESLYNELVAKYSRIFPDFDNSIVKSGKAAALGCEFDYRPELQQISAILKMELLLVENNDYQPQGGNMVKLSDNAEKLLKFIVDNKKDDQDLFYISLQNLEYPPKTTVQSALHELEDKGFCYNIQIYMHVSGFRCRMRWYMVEEYYQAKENSMTTENNPSIVQNFYGGQPIINNGSGKMNVTQNNCDTQQLDRAISELKECANTMSAEMRDTVEEYIEVIETLKTNNPKKGTRQIIHIQSQKIMLTYTDGEHECVL